jgi:hypothetical protein
MLELNENKKFGSLLPESPYQLFSNYLREVLTRNIIKITLLAPSWNILSVTFYICHQLVLKALNMFHMIKELKKSVPREIRKELTFGIFFWCKDY